MLMILQLRLKLKKKLIGFGLSSQNDSRPSLWGRLARSLAYESFETARTALSTLTSSNISARSWTNSDSTSHLIRPSAIHQLTTKTTARQQMMILESIQANINRLWEV